MVRGAPSPTPEPSPEPVFRPLSPPPRRPPPRPAHLNPPHPQRVLRPRSRDRLDAIRRLIREPDHRPDFHRIVGGPHSDRGVALLQLVRIEHARRDAVAAERRAREIRATLSDLLTEGSQRLHIDVGNGPRERRDWDALVRHIIDEHAPPPVPEESMSSDDDSGLEFSMSRSGGSSPTPLRRPPTPGPGPIHTRTPPTRRTPPVFIIPPMHADDRASHLSPSNTSSEDDEFIEADEFIADAAESVQGEPTQPASLRLTTAAFTLTGPAPPSTLR